MCVFAIVCFTLSAGIQPSEQAKAHLTSLRITPLPPALPTAPTPSSSLGCAPRTSPARPWAAFPSSTWRAASGGQVGERAVCVWCVAGRQNSVLACRESKPSVFSSISSIAALLSLSYCCCTAAVLLLYCRCRRHVRQRPPDAAGGRRDQQVAAGAQGVHPGAGRRREVCEGER